MEAFVQFAMKAPAASKYLLFKLSGLLPSLGGSEMCETVTAARCNVLIGHTW
jgi:hypothetical protein